MDEEGYANSTKKMKPYGTTYYIKIRAHRIYYKKGCLHNLSLSVEGAQITKHINLQFSRCLIENIYMYQWQHRMKFFKMIPTKKII